MSNEIARRAPSLTEQKEYARALATAGTLPKQYRERPGDILLAMAYAESLNLPVAQVFVGIHIIEGKPSMSSELMNALIRRAGHRTRIEQSPPGPWVEAWASFTIVRADDPEPYVEVFSMRDALQAKLLTINDNGVIRSRTKNGEPTPWENYPRAMLKARAISAAARAHCADVLAGVSYTPEEIRPLSQQAYIDAEPEPEPARNGAAAPPSAPAATPEPAAEGEDTDRAPAEPQGANEPVEVVEADPPPEDDWRTEWHERLRAASIYNDGLTTAINLGNEAAEHGDTALVEAARERYREIAHEHDEMARDGS
jgi:RecT family